MNILIFIIVLGVLIFVHELGHFLFAKLFKIRVDEFGFGYPPRMFKLFAWKGTQFTVNWIPFGGFVKIFGESDQGEALNPEEQSVSLVYKPWWQQLLVMFGGILFNILFAWILLSILYMSGVDAPVSSAPQNYRFESTELTVTGVLPDSPAMEAGLRSGDIIKEYYNIEETVTVTDETVSVVSDFIHETGETRESVGIVVLQQGDIKQFRITPEQGLVPGRYGVGISLDRVGELKLPVHQALVYGARNTWNFTVAIVKGFGQLISGQVSFSNISGPVGIVGQVGQASAIGFLYLLGFTALLSLNLAVLNIVPFPALDGGRMLIVIIEAIIRKRLNPTAVAWVNTIGFFLLILLMIVVTTNDVIQLF